MVEILDAGSDVDIYEETELIKFSRMLFDAQKRALAEEKAKGKKQKTYNVSSWATAYCRKRHHKDLVAWGQLSVPNFMKWREAKRKEEELTASVEESKESSDDITASVSWIRSWSNEPSTSKGTDIEKLTSAARADCCQIAPGPVATETHCQAVQDLAEEEEGTRSEDENENENENETKTRQANITCTWGGPHLLRNSGVMF